MVGERYVKDEVVLCYHGDIMYEAKILEVKRTEDKKAFEYRVHYKGWKNTYVLYLSRSNFPLHPSLSNDGNDLFEVTANPFGYLMLTVRYRWDDWVMIDRLRKFTEDNRELAATLRREAEALVRSRAKSHSKKKEAARGSEDRQSTGKGTKRGKENGIEKACNGYLYICSVVSRGFRLTQATGRGFPPTPFSTHHTSRVYQKHPC